MMKYRLARQLDNEEIRGIIAREVRRQKMYVPKLSKGHLKELAQVAQAIVKRGLPESFVLKKLPGELGHGIFLHPKAKAILRGQIIAPYTGEVMFVPQSVVDDSAYAFELMSKVILNREEQKQLGGKLGYQPRRRYCVHVEALKKGNFTRFINHSDKPNVVAGLYQIPTNSYGLICSPLEVIYRAKKRINPGEQLLVCYEGDDASYWGAMGIKPVPITATTFQLNSSLKLVKQ
jgi:hypothetical protein